MLTTSFGSAEGSPLRCKTISRTICSIMLRSSAPVVLMLLSCLKKSTDVCGLGDQHIDGVQRAHVCETLMSNLRAVGDDNHFLGRVHHCLFGAYQQQVAIEVSAVVDAGYAQN